VPREVPDSFEEENAVMYALQLEPVKHHISDIAMELAADGRLVATVTMVLPDDWLARMLEFAARPAPP
jgi:hypothetical protein